MVIQQFSAAIVVVECGDGSSILLEVLKTTTGSEVVKLGGVELTNKDLPSLGFNTGKGDGDFDFGRVFDADIQMLSSQDSTEICGNCLH